MKLWPFSRQRRPDAQQAETVNADMQAPTPEVLSYLVGDLHGCHDKLAQMLALIEEDRDGRACEIVFMGDYVDRGPKSDAVLRTLFGLHQDPAQSVTCLLGNHERMMLNFLSDPGKYGGRWLAMGGQDTLISFGVGHPAGDTAEDRLNEQARALRQAMGDALFQWLSERPLWWQSGNVAAVHAFAAPDKPLEQNSERMLLWGRPPSDVAPRMDGTWLVFGHTVFERPWVKNGHVAIDTGAYRSGVLSCAVFDGGDLRFISA